MVASELFGLLLEERQRGRMIMVIYHDDAQGLIVREGWKGNTNDIGVWKPITTGLPGGVIQFWDELVTSRAAIRFLLDQVNRPDRPKPRIIGAAK